MLYPSTAVATSPLFGFESQNTAAFRRGLVRNAVCELKFPTLMTLGERRPPSAFVHALRKQYPNPDVVNSLTVGPGSVGEQSIEHVLRSLKGDWTIVLKVNAIVIETSKYKGFDDFRERINQIVEAASKIIDSDFFTRVGLRYTNIIRSTDGTLHGWVSPMLLGPLERPEINGVYEYSNRLVMQTNDQDDGIIMQHGIRWNSPEEPATKAVPDYVIDIDNFNGATEVKEVMQVIDRLHARSFDVFDWAIDEKTRTSLKGPASDKKGEQ